MFTLCPVVATCPAMPAIGMTTPRREPASVPTYETRHAQRSATRGGACDYRFLFLCPRADWLAYLQHQLLSTVVHKQQANPVHTKRVFCGTNLAAAAQCGMQQ